jgi:hypothetical protein
MMHLQPDRTGTCVLLMASVKGGADNVALTEVACVKGAEYCMCTLVSSADDRFHVICGTGHGSTYAEVFEWDGAMARHLFTLRRESGRQEAFAVACPRVGEEWRLVMNEPIGHPQGFTVRSLPLGHHVFDCVPIVGFLGACVPIPVAENLLDEEPSYRMYLILPPPLLQEINRLWR